MISPGRDGHVYVTPDQYGRGGEAQQRLALPRTPIAYVEIPEERLYSLSRARKVAPHFGQPGGGREQYVEHPVDAEGLTWQEIAP